ncbi:MAG: SPOR domain-containing protein [Phycisphaeraceae bacterium]|nr:SPOR domain-containing protein [Phycisphaeraceae bacterium]
MRMRHVVTAFAVVAGMWSTSAPAQNQPATEPPRRLREEGKRLFGSPEAPGGGVKKDGAQAASGGWVIFIASFHDPEAASLVPGEKVLTGAEQARVALSQIRTVGQLQGAYTQDRGAMTWVVLGSYDDPGKDEAQAELKRVQAIMVNGSRPYAGAFLAPPAAGGVAGSIPELDLRKVRARLGAAAMYTLEIGYYGRPDTQRPSADDLADFRKAAEQAAVQLRSEGEMAFYFHGPNRSSVTVGVFDDTDFDPQEPLVRSPRLHQARKLHPYHLFNGAAYKQKSKVDGKSGYIPCPLVKIPEDGR